jgi:GAF domain-containing protein
MPDTRKRRTIAITLVALGVLFLMVSNKILLGWVHIWPIFPIGAGMLFLRAWSYRGRRAERWYLFTGATLSLLGLFLLLFSTGILDWAQMDTLWPVFPLIAGVGFLAESAVSSHGTPALITGSAIVIFTLVAFFVETRFVDPRVASPFVRFWPLVLVLAGVVLWKTKPKHRSSDEGLEELRHLIDDGEPAGGIPKDLEAKIMDKVSTAGNAADATGALVHGLKDNLGDYTWVGLYRLADDTLTLADSDYAGYTPELREIALTDGICGAAASADETIVVPDVRKDTRYLTCSVSIQSEIVVPVRHGGAVIAVLDVDSDKLAAFDDDDRRFLESLVEKAAPYLKV